LSLNNCFVFYAVISLHF